MLDMQLECFNKVICRSKPYEAYLVVFNSFDASWRKRTEAVPRHAAASVSLYGHTSEMVRLVKGSRANYKFRRQH